MYFDTRIYLILVKYASIHAHKGYGKGFHEINIIMKHAERPLCRCGMRPVAVNYYKKGVPHYRTQCDKCIRQDKKLETTSHTEWKASGYTKKPQCERCGFKAQHRIQLDVYHQDGNRKNNDWKNLKTVCANCHRILYITGKGWKQGDLIPDF